MQKMNLAAKLPLISITSALFSMVIVSLVVKWEVDAIGAIAMERALTAAELNALIWEIIITVGSIIFFPALMGMVVSKRSVKPLGDITRTIEKLAGGDTDITLEYQDRGDEIGDISQALVVFRDNMSRHKEMEERQHRLQEQAETEKKKARNDLADKFEQQISDIVNSVASAASEFYQTAQNLNANIGNVDSKAGTVSATSGKVADNVNAVASAAEQMSASVKEIASQVSKSTAVVTEAVSRTEGAGASAKSLEEATAKIGDVVQLIQDIAEQINLLALNATIESARAGDAGKGFAVVASEVKNLAAQTTKATEEIAQQINAVQSVSSDVIAALSAIAQSIHNVNDYAGGIASAVEEQSATTNEIAGSMQSAASGAKNISSNIQEVTGASVEARESSSQLMDAANQLSQDAEKLSAEISTFIADMRQG